MTEVTGYLINSHVLFHVQVLVCLPLVRVFLRNNVTIVLLDASTFGSGFSS